MPATGPVPTLSQVHAWDTEHLIRAAARWTDTANRWEEVFTQLSAEMPCPGGSLWEGEAAEAAQQQAYTDRLKVIRAADQLHGAAAVAQAGARQLQAAKQSVVAAVAAAGNARFHVGQDFTVSDRQAGGNAAILAARRAQAESFAADIGTRVASLVAADQQVAAQIATAASGVGTLDFGSNQIQAVDFKQSPVPEPESPDDSGSPPPLPGWTAEQKMQVAREIAQGHANQLHGRDFPGMNEDDIARWIFNTMNDPSTLAGTSTKTGALALYRDGTIIFVDPNNKDYGTTFRPTRDPLEYFLDSTAQPSATLAPPQSGDLPPLPPGLTVPSATPPVVEQVPPPNSGGWGTYISPEEAAESGGDIGNLGKALESYLPNDPKDPNNMA